MPAFPPADVVYNIVTVVAPVVGVIAGALLAALVHRWRQRRKGDEDLRTTVRRLTDAYYGRRPSLFEKNPPAGLEDRVEALEAWQGDVSAVLGEHTDKLNTLIEKVTPNGGTTRESGDLLLLIAQRLGITVPEGGHET